MFSAFSISVKLCADCMYFPSTKEDSPFPFKYPDLESLSIKGLISCWNPCLLSKSVFVMTCPSALRYTFDECERFPNCIKNQLASFCWLSALSLKKSPVSLSKPSLLTNKSTTYSLALNPLFST